MFSWAKVASLFLSAARWFQRAAERKEYKEDGKNEVAKETLEEVVEGKKARDAVDSSPTLAAGLLRDILVTSSSDEHELVLSKLPSGVPSRDGPSINHKGNTWQLRSLEDIMFPFSRRSLKSLATCHPELQFIIRELACEFDITVLEGTRSMERQGELFSSGASKVPPGKSKHNRVPSDAVDICPARAPRFWAQGKDLPREEYDKVANRFLDIATRNNIAIRWGGDWDGDGDTTDQTFNDLVHFERRSKA